MDIINKNKKSLIHCTMKKTAFIAFALLYVSSICGQSKVEEAPEWFFHSPVGEYVGVSFPMEDQKLAQQQAERIALLSYLLQHDSNGSLKGRGMDYSEGASDDNENYRQQFIAIIELWLPKNYSVTKTAKNKYGEVFVSVKVLFSEINPNAKVKGEIFKRYNTQENISRIQFAIEDNAKENANSTFLTMYKQGKNFSIEARQTHRRGNFVDSCVFEPEQYMYEQKTNSANIKKSGLMKGKSFTPLENSLGIAYQIALLEFLSNKAYWERKKIDDSNNKTFHMSMDGNHEVVQEDRFDLTKRNASPIQSISIVDNELFIQLQMQTQ
jgi:hypothetical protein